MVKKLSIGRHFSKIVAIKVGLGMKFAVGRVCRRIFKGETFATQHLIFTSHY
jgi:hypothetical protein